MEGCAILSVDNLPRSTVHSCISFRIQWYIINMIYDKMLRVNELYYTLHDLPQLVLIHRR